MIYSEIYDKLKLVLNRKQIELIYKKVGDINNTLNGVHVYTKGRTFLNKCECDPTQSLEILFGNELEGDTFNHSRKYAVLFKDTVSGDVNVLVYVPKDKSTK